MPGWQQLWSLTPNSNQTADPQINWREGMAPSQVNDSDRMMMTKAKQTLLDQSGALVTGGTSTAYTLATNEGFSALVDGMSVAARIHAINGAAPTLNVDGQGAVPIRSLQDTPVPAGGLLLGSIAEFVYWAAGPAWILKGAMGLNGMFIGTAFEYTGLAVPPLCVEASGQAISRTTFAPYFALVGTHYGVGDNSTTFNVPDHGNRAVAGRGGGRLTIAGSGIDGGVIGAAGGAQSVALIAANNGPHTHGVNDPGHTHSYNVTSNNEAVDGNGVQNVAAETLNASTTGSSATGISIQSAGSGTPHNNVQPTIIHLKCIFVGA